MDERCQIDLAAAAPFSVGPLLVQPALRQVSTVDGISETLEPRVMQVFVALALAKGGIVTRDELEQRCWQGRVVGDDSINRVLSRLRRLSEQRPAGSFRIETITKVGYRMIGEVTLSPTPQAATARAVTSRAETAAKRKWPRRSLALGCAAVALAVLAAGLIVERHGSARPTVAVEMFVPTGPGIPLGLAAQLRAETVDFLANEKFYAVWVGGEPGKAKPDWQVRGTITPTDGGRRLVLFADLIRAGSNAAVARLRIERDATQPMLARSLGLRIGRTSGCILLGVTNPELTGGFDEEALPALAASCVTWHDKTSSLAARIERFRDNAAALPRSAYFRARLGEMLGDQAADGTTDPISLRAEGAKYTNAAERLDPGQPHVFLARARLLPAFDFAGREAMFRKALAARPSDCACEFGDYSTFLSMVGRNGEARTYADHAREKEPKNIPWLRRAGETAAITGDFANARVALSTVADYLPEPGSLDVWRFNLGVWSKDWLLAKAMVDRQPDATLRSAQAALVGGLARKDGARVAAAGQAFARLANKDATNDRASVTGLAMSGSTADAVAAADRLIARHPMSISLLFEPSFEGARRTSAFATLSTKVGLVAYWRISGQPPDFCAATAPPAICEQAKRRHPSLAH